MATEKTYTAEEMQALLKAQEQRLKAELAPKSSFTPGAYVLVTPDGARVRMFSLAPPRKGGGSGGVSVEKATALVNLLAGRSPEQAFAELKGHDNVQRMR